ncbi:MAG: hypothetical protein EBY21_14190 [Alphaproteobacteria bacterium]|jgi:hypothetical protein|nr:hypothetical protein [Alphaproteobacteria bacterium]
MKTEQRTFDHPAQVISVARYSKAERNGLIAGDLILSFGSHSPTEMIENPEMTGQLKAGEWLLMVRGGVPFRLAISEGLEGCVYEATTPAENITLPSSGQWETYWGGIQTGGAMVLVPENFSWVWSLFPPLLYARFRNWQMITAIILVWCIALVEGPITFALSYAISVAVALAGGSKMLIDASQKQGYSPRGSYGLASYATAAALEIKTAEILKPQFHKPNTGDYGASAHAGAD